MSNERILKVGELTPGTRVSGAFSDAYFDPTTFKIYEFSGVGNGRPMSAHNGRNLYLGQIPLDVSSRGIEKLENWLHGQEPILLEISEGYNETTFRNGNIRGHLTEEGQETLQEFRDLFGEFVATLPTVWKAVEYFSQCKGECLAELRQATSIRDWAQEQVESSTEYEAELDLNDVIAFARDLVSDEINNLGELL